MDNTFSISRTADYTGLKFAREQSRSMRNRDWENRLKRRATYLEIGSVIGFVMFMALFVWVH